MYFTWRSNPGEWQTSDWLAGIIERFEQSEGCGVLAENPTWGRAHPDKKTVSKSSAHIRQPHCMSERFLRRLVLLKPGHNRRLIFRQIALWIDRWLPAFG